MKHFLSVSLLVLVFSIDPVQGIALDDTVKNRYTDFSIYYNRSDDYASSVSGGLRMVVNDSVREGIRFLADGLNRMNIKEKTDRIYNYHIAELVSFIKLLNSNTLTPEEQELGEMLVSAMFKDPEHSLAKKIERYSGKYPGSVFITRVNVFYSSFFMTGAGLDERLNKLLALDSLHIGAYTLKAEALFRDQQYRESIRYFTRVIAWNPEYTHAFNTRGLCHAALGEQEDAVHDYSTAIGLSPGYVQLYNNRGNALQELNQYEASISDYRKAIGINPAFEWPYNNIAVSFENLNEPDSAIYYYNMAIFKNSMNATFYDNKGNLYYELDEYEKAIGDYSKAIILEPDNIYYYTHRANAYYFNDELDAALHDYEKAVEIAPDFTYALACIGDCYYRKEDYQQAVIQCNKAVENDPDYKYAYIRLGLSYGQLGDHDSEIESFRKAVAIDSTYEGALGNLGWAYYCVGDYDSCIYYSRKALQYDDKAFYAMFNIALSELRRGNFEEARVLYRNYLDLYNTMESGDPGLTGGPDGAIQDLKDLLNSDILVNEVDYILNELFVR